MKTNLHGDGLSKYGKVDERDRWPGKMKGVEKKCFETKRDVEKEYLEIKIGEEKYFEIKRDEEKEYLEIKRDEEKYFEIKRDEKKNIQR
jgi:hypothetical protein